eukprot:scaffold79290_cov41-Attheya_sp.AAC.4
MDAKYEVKVDHVEELAEALSPVLQCTNTDTIKEIIHQLLQDPSKLMLRTTRVEELPFDKVDRFFNVEHHILAATSFFRMYHAFGKRTRAVVFGHKNQGKTQFLFFLIKMLQALGEGVVYLDPKVAPVAEDKVTAEWLTEKARQLDTNLAEWKGPFVAFLRKYEATGLGAWTKSWFVAQDPVAVEASKAARALDVFATEGAPTHFMEFQIALFNFVKASKMRVWMIVDKAIKYDSRFKIPWPQEQETDFFHFIMTGSIGIHDFVSMHGLSSWVWDLPVFTPQEAAAFALKLATALEL